MVLYTSLTALTDVNTVWIESESKTWCLNIEIEYSNVWKWCSKAHFYRAGYFVSVYYIIIVSWNTLLLMAILIRYLYMLLLNLLVCILYRRKPESRWTSCSAGLPRGRSHAIHALLQGWNQRGEICEMFLHIQNWYTTNNTNVL